jgi:hypothetical protein
LSSPASEHDAHRPRLFRRKLQPSRRVHRQTDQFPDHGGKPAETQPFLHGGQRRFFPITFAKHDAIRMKPRLCNGGKKQVWAGHAPQDFPARPGSDAGHEERSRSPIDRPSPTTGDLVQRTESEPSPRKYPVELCNAERQNLPCALWAAFQLADAFAKLCQQGVEGMVGHGRIVAPSRCSAVFQADMFIICSDCFRESIGPAAGKSALAKLLKRIPQRHQGDILSPKARKIFLRCLGTNNSRLHEN